MGQHLRQPYPYLTAMASRFTTMAAKLHWAMRSGECIHPERGSSCWTWRWDRLANPQTENGYVKIANELYEALLRINLSSYESRVLHAIIRLTYGFNRKKARISRAQLTHLTGIAPSNVSHTLAKLMARNLIVREGKYLSVQKDYEQWYALPKRCSDKHPTSNSVVRKRCSDTHPQGVQIHTKKVSNQTLKGVDVGTSQAAIKDILKDNTKDSGFVFSLYEKNIGMLTPIIAEEINQALERWPPDWIADATKEAVAQNKRTWRYIEGILKRWERDGRGPPQQRQKAASGGDGKWRMR